MPRRCGSTLRAGPAVLQIRNRAVVLDGRSVPLTAGPMSVLRALGDARGDVVSRAELLRCLPGTSDDPHALDSTIARLRGALGMPGLVRNRRQTRLPPGCGTGTLLRAQRGVPPTAFGVVPPERGRADFTKREHGSGSWQVRGGSTRAGWGGIHQKRVRPPREVLSGGWWTASAGSHSQSARLDSSSVPSARRSAPAPGRTGRPGGHWRWRGNGSPAPRCRPCGR